MIVYMQLHPANPMLLGRYAQVSASFEALASAHELAADTSAVIITYFADEKASDSLLAVVASDTDLLKEWAPHALRRHRIVAVLAEICADAVGSAHSAVPVVSVPAPFVVVSATDAMSSVAYAHAASDTASSHLSTACI